MAKNVVLSFEGAELKFSPSRVDRAKLYGVRKRIAVDSSGSTCTKAALTADGFTLITSGMTSQGYFAPDGRWVARNEMVGLDIDERVVEIKPSTLGVAQSVEGPVDPVAVLRLDVESVFALEPDDVASTLVTSMKSGEIYRCAFNYAAGLEVEVAYLVANDEGVFALVGKPVDIAWSEQGAIFVAESTDDDADDLDFDQL
jgi:hypothetical protein